MLKLNHTQLMEEQIPRIADYPQELSSTVLIPYGPVRNTLPSAKDLLSSGKILIQNSQALRAEIRLCYFSNPLAFTKRASCSLHVFSLYCSNTS